MNEENLQSYGILEKSNDELVKNRLNLFGFEEKYILCESANLLYHANCLDNHFILYKKLEFCLTLLILLYFLNICPIHTSEKQKQTLSQFLSVRYAHRRVFVRFTQANECTICDKTFIFCSIHVLEGNRLLKTAIRLFDRKKRLFKNLLHSSYGLYNVLIAFQREMGALFW